MVDLCQKGLFSTKLSLVGVLMNRWKLNREKNQITKKATNFTRSTNL